MPRAADLIADLDLAPHPEGGYFREVYRSARQVTPDDARAARAALTTIFFLLSEGQHSQWHRVRSDEAWHFYEGDPLELLWIDADRQLHSEVLSSGTPGARPVAVVPADCWQAARPLGAYALVGCTVGPGFDFADFEMLTGTSPDRVWIGALPGVPPEVQQKGDERREGRRPTPIGPRRRPSP